MKKFRDYNVIMVTLDGLRQDRIKKLPILSSIKNESLYFSNMITAAPYTLASMHAILSGTYPSKNGVNAYYNMLNFKSKKFPTFPEILRKQGYYTACDIIHDAIIPKKGFDERKVFDEKKINFKKRHSRLIERLSKKRKKFFLYLHYTEPHKHLVKELKKINTDDEYNSKTKLKKDNEDSFFSSFRKNQKRYDSYMKELDEYVNEIKNAIKKTGIEKNTILIFHSDHGTSLGEKRGEKFYGVFTYNYTIKIFTIIYSPNIEFQEIKDQCQSIDLYPTIIDMLALERKQISHLQGKNLYSLLNKKNNKDRVAFVETGGLYGPWPSPNKSNVFCIIKDNKKLIYNDTPETWEFYDLKKDPRELKNIFEKKSIEIPKYRKLLLKHFKENNIKTKIKN